ncbi:MAG: retroviral-like aspartic protease family protein [Candidatus Omnitrophica bacterium]|nr:retroviral-like aspartic protease family protein [Candidatus Omnitrophota bacterium]
MKKANAKMLNSAFFIIACVLIVVFVSEARPDIIYLRNGRSIEGIIDKEKEDSVSLDVGFGTVRFRVSEIKDIYRSTPEERARVRERWAKEREIEQKKWKKKEEERKQVEREKKLAPKKAGFSEANDRIMVSALLNKKVKAELLLDTGATLVLLSKSVVDKIKEETKLREGSIIKLQVGDGRKVDARLILLDTLSVEGAEAESVIGAVLLDSEEDMGDGVLGMSFLNKFNFQIDNTNKKIILKKLEDK